MPVMNNDDVADAAVAKKSIARNEEILSEAELDELLAARTPLAFRRRKRGFTQTELAKAAEISQGFLSEIESGLKTGDVTVLQRIAVALEISLLELVPDLPSSKRKSGGGFSGVKRRK